MRVVILSCAALLLAFAPAGAAAAPEPASSPAVSPTAAKYDLAIDSGRRRIVFRYVTELDPVAHRSEQRNRVILSWRYHSESGMPTREDKVRMDELEDALALAVMKDGFASLALVSTGDDLREWIFYAKSDDEFLERMNLALRGHERFPLEIVTAEDPAWESYEKFRRWLAGR